MNIFTKENMAFVFENLEKCRGIEQSPLHHPEGDVFNHSIQVMEIAFRETYDTDLIIAAMLHDIGKVENSKLHEYIALDILKDNVSAKTLFLIQHHMRIWYYIMGSMRKKSKCEFFINHSWLPELLQLARWDHMGRVPNKKNNYSRVSVLDRLNKAAYEKYE